MPGSLSVIVFIRPAWTTSMDVQELDLKERESVIDWRRQLAM
jgi:hypothetical protein